MNGTSPLVKQRVEATPRDEVTRLVRTMRENEELRGIGMLHAAMNGGGAQQPQQSETTKEIIGMAQAVATLQQGAATTALSVADLERKRRIEAEQEAGAAAEAARVEEREKAEGMVGVIKEITALTLKYQQDSAQMQQQLAAASGEAQLAAIRAEIVGANQAQELRLKLVEERYERQLEKEREERQRLQQERDYYARPKTFQDHQADLMSAALREGRVSDLLNVLGVNRSKTPQEQLDELHVKLYEEEKRAEIAGKVEDREQRSQIIQEGLGMLGQIAQTLAGASGNPVGAPFRNGLPSDPPGMDEPPAGAPVIVPQGPPSMDGGAMEDFDLGSEGI